jgi:hypothetical protein
MVWVCVVYIVIYFFYFFKLYNYLTPYLPLMIVSTGEDVLGHLLDGGISVSHRPSPLDRAFKLNSAGPKRLREQQGMSPGTRTKRLRSLLQIFITKMIS